MKQHEFEEAMAKRDTVISDIRAAVNGGKYKDIPDLVNKLTAIKLPKT